jgi:hypothetical protein
MTANSAWGNKTRLRPDYSMTSTTKPLSKRKQADLDKPFFYGRALGSAKAGEYSNCKKMCDFHPKEGPFRC